MLSSRPVTAFYMQQMCWIYQYLSFSFYGYNGGFKNSQSWKVRSKLIAEMYTWVLLYVGTPAAALNGPRLLDHYTEKGFTQACGMQVTASCKAQCESECVYLKGGLF